MNPGISLCTFVKDEAHCLNNMINSVYDFVNEVVVVDTGSTDATLTNLADYKKVRIYKTRFSDFGSMRTLTAHLAREPWVLMLDADEILSNADRLWNLTQDPMVCAYAFPRMRWLDLEMTQQTEKEAWPDWQVRFFRNNHGYTWKRELHEEFTGAPVKNFHSDDSPVIHHFQDVHKNALRRAVRDDLYMRLAKVAGVHVHGGKPIE